MISFLSYYPNENQLLQESEKRLLPTLRSTNTRHLLDVAIRNEAFSTVVIVATIDDTGVEDFMSKACDLCNNYMFGTLSCSLAVSDSSTKIAPVKNAIADLKYGCIMLNGWTGQSYGLFRLNWSGHPSEKLESIESGIGSVCNAMAFEHIEKSVCFHHVLMPCISTFANPTRRTLVISLLSRNWSWEFPRKREASKRCKNSLSQSR